jgi:enamine deaminase RidA (YjgF/YER057c/UK114 family)
VPASIERAGNWIFGTGFRATSAPALFEQMREALSEAGSSLSRVVRLDQYYPDARCVPAYHQARKLAFGAGGIAPSTSVIVSDLQTPDAQMDVQVIAATSASGYVAEPVQAGLNRPDASGYTPCLRVGDMIFVAGQLARDASGKLAARGTGAETDYMVRERLIPALEAAQSGLDLVLKAQVYLSKPQDLSEFWQSWTRAFAGRVPPTTVVALRHPAFLTAEATIEINVVAAHRSARARIREIEGEVPARALDGLLFLPGLSGTSVSEVMDKARPIFAAAGSDLANVVRMLVFAADLADLRVAQMPFTAVRVPTGLTVDLWGYAPQS